MFLSVGRSLSGKREAAIESATSFEISFNLPTSAVQLIPYKVNRRSCPRFSDNFKLVSFYDHFLATSGSPDVLISCRTGPHCMKRIDFTCGGFATKAASPFVIASWRISFPILFLILPEFWIYRFWQRKRKEETDFIFTRIRSFVAGLSSR